MYKPSKVGNANEPLNVTTSACATSREKMKEAM